MISGLRVGQKVQVKMTFHSLEYFLSLSTLVLDYSAISFLASELSLFTRIGNLGNSGTKNMESIKRSNLNGKVSYRDYSRLKKSLFW